MKGVCIMTSINGGMTRTAQMLKGLLQRQEELNKQVKEADEANQKFKTPQNKELPPGSTRSFSG